MAGVIKWWWEVGEDVGDDVGRYGVERVVALAIGLWLECDVGVFVGSGGRDSNLLEVLLEVDGKSVEGRR